MPIASTEAVLAKAMLDEEAGVQRRWSEYADWKWATYEQPLNDDEIARMQLEVRTAGMKKLIEHLIAAADVLGTSVSGGPVTAKIV